MPLLSACSRCEEPTPPGVAVCAGCARLDERAAASSRAAVTFVSWSGGTEAVDTSAALASAARASVVVDLGTPPFLHFRGHRTASMPVVDAAFAVGPGRRVSFGEFLAPLPPVPPAAFVGLAA